MTHGRVVWRRTGLPVGMRERQAQGLFQRSDAVMTKQPLMRDVVIVSGLPRSGTSMMMKMLEAGGVPVLTDRQRAADEDNPRGYYEFERVKQLPKGDTAWIADAPGHVVKVISALLQHLPGGYSYKVVFMRRRMEEILASQRKMLLRRGEPADSAGDAQMARLFAKHLETVEGWLAAHPNFDVLHVDYNAMLANARPQVAALNAFLGGALDEQRMLEVVDPALYRNR
jgi:hypothetical protein